MHFAGLQQLRVQIDAPIKELRLHIPDTEYLNLEGLTFATANGAPLPRWTAHVSSAQSETMVDAGRLLSGMAIHTRKEPLPWWRVRFSEPAEISHVEISNRCDSWAARAYGLCVDWLRNDGVGETFDNLALPVLLARLDAFQARVRRTTDELANTDCLADPDVLRRVERVALAFHDLTAAMRRALSERSTPPEALCTLRGAALAEFAGLIAIVDDERLRAPRLSRRWSGKAMTGRARIRLRNRSWRRSFSRPPSCATAGFRSSGFWSSSASCRLARISSAWSMGSSDSARGLAATPRCSRSWCGRTASWAAHWCATRCSMCARCAR
jgi:hypothetical protein